MYHLSNQTDPIHKFFIVAFYDDLSRDYHLRIIDTEVGVLKSSQELTTEYSSILPIHYIDLSVISYSSIAIKAYFSYQSCISLNNIITQVKDQVPGLVAIVTSNSVEAALNELELMILTGQLR
jgi:uncharacterized membrane protein